MIYGFNQKVNQKVDQTQEKSRFLHVYSYTVQYVVHGRWLPTYIEFTQSDVRNWLLTITCPNTTEG
jgi:hypothetical protein